MTTFFERYVSLHDDVVDEVERLARQVLRKHPNLDEFMMGMGTAFFTSAGETIPTDQFKYMSPVDAFLNEWDEWLRITGTPMRFTAEGPRVTNW